MIYFDVDVAALLCKQKLHVLDVAELTVVRQKVAKEGSRFLEQQLAQAASSGLNLRHLW